MSRSLKEKLKDRLDDWVIRSIGLIDATKCVVVADWDPADEKKRYPLDKDKKNKFWTTIVSIDMHNSKVWWKVIHGGLGLCHLDGGVIDGKQYACIVEDWGRSFFIDYDKHTFEFEGTLNTVISNIRLIEEHFYVGAAASEVWRREAPGSWRLISERLHKRCMEQRLVGDATEVNGFSEEDLYFCSDAGELWHFDGKEWTQMDIPVNFPLDYLVCAEDGYVYTAWKTGRLIRGRGERWEELVDADAVDEAPMLLSMTFYQGSLYAGTGSGIVKYENGKWVKTAIGEVHRANILIGRGNLMLMATPYSLYLYDGEKTKVIYGSKPDAIDAGFVVNGIFSSALDPLESGHKLLNELDKGKKTK